MRIKLIPQLRFLNPSLPVSNFCTMKPNPSKKSSRLFPVFSGIFPLRLKYQSFSKKRGLPCLLTQQFDQNEIDVHCYSTRASRSRTDSGSDVRASKSLIDDEAELSDWISGLSSSSYKTNLYSDGDADGDRRDSGRNMRRGGDESGRKRRKEGFSDDSSFPETGRRNGRKDSFGKNSDSLRDRGTALGRERGQGDGGLRRSEIGRGRKEFDDYGVSKSVRQRGSTDSFASFSGNLRGKSSAILRGKDQRSDGLRSGEKTGGRRVLTNTDEDNVDDDEEEIRHLDLGELMSEEVEDDDDEEVPKKGKSFIQMDGEDIPPSSPGHSLVSDDSYLSKTRFDQCSISSLSLKGIKDAGYEKMTLVQEATLPVILEGKDVLAKAKTGTGKTVAFLLPSVEVVAKSLPVSRDQKRPPIFVLVICPTRELACQVAAEANTLLKYHPTIGVQVVIGGTRLALEQKRMQTNPCQILVATPGRLKDHLENTAGFATRLMGVKVLVLDEADRLLGMGFRKDIEKIIAAVPKQRQTLLFSATIPDEVRQISHVALKRDHAFINTVQEGTEETHSLVKQFHMVAPLDNHFPLLYALLKEHIADNIDYKVLVFCTTAMVTKLVAEILGELNLNVREIHSRKAQAYRTRVSDEFRKSKGLILVTSDVSARGVDYPDVTLVVQVGLPADKEQYIHRLGRTGRKGKEGVGILILAPWEEFFLSTVKNLPITKAQLPSMDPDTKRKVERAMSHVEMKSKESAYQAWLGYYNSSKGVGHDKCRLVELANEFSQSMGLDNPPAIPKLVLNKMGLRNIPGLRSK